MKLQNGHTLEAMMDEMKSKVENLTRLVEASHAGKSAPPIMLPDEFNRLFKICDNTRRKWERSGLITPIKIDRRVYYNRQEVDELIARKSKTA